MILLRIRRQHDLVMAMRAQSGLCDRLPTEGALPPAPTVFSGRAPWRATATSDVSDFAQ